MTTTFRCSFCERVGNSFPDGVDACKICRKNPKIAKKVALLQKHYLTEGYVDPEVPQITAYHLKCIIVNTCRRHHDNCELRLYPKTCCACADKREYSSDNKYINYIDGQGHIPSITRYEHYCPPCKEHCEVQVKTIEDRLKTAHAEMINSRHQKTMPDNDE
jgi:hypothetical protein